MIRALVLMNVERGKVPITAKQLATMDEVVDVYSVAGGYDLVAIIQSAGIRTPRGDRHGETPDHRHREPHHDTHGVS